MFSKKIIGCLFAIVLTTISLAGSTVAAEEFLIDLPRHETQLHLDNIQLKLQDVLRDIFTGAEPRSLEESAAIATVSRSINAESVTYWLLDTPRQISKEVALNTVSLVYSIVTGDTSVALINSLDQLSVKQARQVAIDWLRDYNIQSSSGPLRGIYQDYSGKIEKPDVHYILVYRPEGVGRGYLSAEFRSLEPVFPPGATSRTTWNSTGWQAKGLEKLSPFILRISGRVQERNNLYEWVNWPQVTVEFPQTVDKIPSSEQSGFWGGIFGRIGDWAKRQIEGVAAWLSPSPEDDLPQVDGSELTDLKQAVEELQRTVTKNQDQTPEPLLDRHLIDLIEGLSSTATSLAGLSEENQAMVEEMVKIARYSAEIMKWQAEITQAQDAPDTETEEALEEVEISSSSEEEAYLCQSQQLTAPTHYPVILNELAWMGRTASDNHEWIELRNLSDQAVSLSGWQLFNRNQNLLVVFEEEDIIQPRGFFLLVRTNDSNVPEVAADRIYTGALKNQNEAVYLFNQDCRLQDFVQAQPDWPAGDNESKRTMERRDNLDWQTSYSPHGTPGRTNSSGYQTPKDSETNGSEEVITDRQPPIANAGPDQTVDYNEIIILDASLSGDNVGIVDYRWDTNNDGLFNRTLAEPVLELSAGYFDPGQHTVFLEVADAAGNTDRDSLVITVRPIPRILINEVQFHGETNRDEFIELFNPGLDDVDLSGWTLRKKTSGGSESALVSSSSFEGVIPAGDYFLIATAQTEDDGSSKYRGAVLPDLHFSGQTYYIAADNTILLYGPNGSLIDLVGYGQAEDYDGEPFPDNPPPGVSLGRRWIAEDEVYADTKNNARDFQWQIPTPGLPNQAWVEVIEKEEEEEILQDGSAEFPFLIASCHDLVNINEHPGAFYKLTGNIDCSESQDWNDGQGFIPIGQAGRFPFIGQIDGQNHAISGLHIESQDGGGLFWQLQYPAKVSNLQINGALVQASGYNIGLLAGYVFGESTEKPVIIDNVLVEGKIITVHDATNAPQNVGGLAGYARRAVATNTRAEIDIEADHQNGHKSSRVGGLFGLVDYITIKNSSAVGQISGWKNIGGLIGQTDGEVIIQENYASVDIVGHSTLGGFVGYTWGLSDILINNYATGTVRGHSEEGTEIGGFVGLANSWIDNSYSTGAVYGMNSFGFIGAKASNRTDPVRNSYYDINTSGRSGYRLGSQGLTTLEMKTRDSFSGWDFETVWKIDEGYPRLRQTP